MAHEFGRAWTSVPPTLVVTGSNPGLPASDITCVVARDAESHYAANISPISVCCSVTWGGFARHYQHYPGPCRTLEAVQPGSEDFYTLPDGQTFITSGLRYSAMSEANRAFWRDHDVQGRVYLMNLSKNKVKVAPVELKIASTATFDLSTFIPHGISIWEDKKHGRHTLFIVNHPQREDGLVVSRVERFLYDPNTRALLHQDTVTSPHMKVVNDVQATGEKSFYLTNSNYFSWLPLTVLEVVLDLPLTDVVHCDGNTCTVVDSGQVGPNGVSASHDGQFLYVAMATKELAVYKRHQDNSVTRVQTYGLHSVPDNLQVDAGTGHLYLAAHPIGWQLLTYFGDIANNVSPSQVLQLGTKDGLITSSRELLYDDGHLISGSSAALVYDGSLLVGSVFHNLIICDVTVPLLPA